MGSPRIFDSLSYYRFVAFLTELGLRMSRYAVVIERAADNYSAYVPDLPGCVATGAPVALVEATIREAIRFHIEGLAEDGLPIPEPSARAG